MVVAAIVAFMHVMITNVNTCGIMIIVGIVYPLPDAYVFTVLNNHGYPVLLRLRRNRARAYDMVNRGYGD